MRASVLLVVIVGLFATSQAEILSDLKDLGSNLLNNLLDKGKEIASDLASKLLGSLAGSLTNIGKRELLDKQSWWSKLKDGASKKFGEFKGKMVDGFKGTMDKLKALKEKWSKKFAEVKDDTEMKKDFDDAVKEHGKMQKRIISDLIQKGKDLVSSAVNKAKDLLSGLKAKASSLVSGLLQKGTDILVGKRATLSEHLSNIGGALSGAVAPFKDIVAGLGNTLKGHFSNLVDTVKGHVNALKGKLSGHVDDLKKHGSDLVQHGKNALGALGEVVTDILKQTATNAGPTLDGLSKTLADAGSTVAKHLAGGSN